MALNQGSTEITTVYRGTSLLSAIYMGVNLVWPVGGQNPWVSTAFGNLYSYSINNNTWINTPFGNSQNNF